MGSGGCVCFFFGVVAVVSLQFFGWVCFLFTWCGGRRVCVFVFFKSPSPDPPKTS